MLEKEIIERYVSGKATESEIYWVESHFGTKHVDPFLKEKMKEEWDNQADPEYISLDYLLDKVHRTLHNREHLHKPAFVSQVFHIYIRIAAILLIPVLLTGIFFAVKPYQNSTTSAENKAMSTITAPLAARVAFNLPDGSKGFLNSGSSLRYSTPFSKNREVFLDGEAWFEVAKDKEHPFEVRNGTSVVKVLGTSFNVSAYKDSDFLEVVLEEGKVEFTSDHINKPVQLNPSERLLLKNEAVVVDKIDPSKYKGWTEGKLIFKGDNMKEVAKRIERWYNVKVEINNKELETYVFRGTFKDDSMEEVLHFLSMTSPIDYTITPGHSNNNGLWEKVKITLTKRK